jgi:hypothetical protein
MILGDLAVQLPGQPGAPVFCFVRTYIIGIAVGTDLRAPVGPCALVRPCRPRARGEAATDHALPGLPHYCATVPEAGPQSVPAQDRVQAPVRGEYWEVQEIGFYGTCEAVIAGHGQGAG